MDKKSLILMFVFNKIQHDPRVIRSAECISELNHDINLISCNSDINYRNRAFNSIVFSMKMKGFALLATFYFRCLLYALKNRKRVKIVYVHDYNLVFLGMLLGSFLRIKWIYDAHELLIQKKNYPVSNKGKFFMLLEKISIRRASLVISANYERHRIVSRIFKLKNSTFVANIPPSRELLNLAIEKQDTIIYQGYMSEERNVSYFIKIMNFLPTNIKLKLIGDGPDLIKYKSLVKSLNLGNRILFTGLIPYSKIIEESLNCKVSIVYYKLEGLNNFYCSPNKIFDYAQINLPMIVSPQPFLRNVVKKYNMGEVLNLKNSMQDQAKVILKVLENYDSYTNGFNDFLRTFSYEVEMLRLKKSIKPILENETV
jgi:glycosyltransferase involved in cell wall biosynthesis